MTDLLLQPTGNPSQYEVIADEQIVGRIAGLVRCRPGGVHPLLVSAKQTVKARWPTRLLADSSRFRPRAAAASESAPWQVMYTTAYLAAKNNCLPPRSNVWLRAIERAPRAKRCTLGTPLVQMGPREAIAALARSIGGVRSLVHFSGQVPWDGSFAPIPPLRVEARPGACHVKENIAYSRISCMFRHLFAIRQRGPCICLD